jgi:hypothetical protein
MRCLLINIDYTLYTAEELEDVWQQIDDYEYSERAVEIYLVMHKRKIARFDDQPEASSFENDSTAYLWYSNHLYDRYNQEEEYQYQQRELSAKEQRVVKLIEKRCQ